MFGRHWRAGSLLSPPPPAAAVFPHFGEQRHPERTAPSDVQDGGQGRVNSGQNAERVGAFIPEGVTFRAC